MRGETDTQDDNPPDVATNDQRNQTISFDTAVEHTSVDANILAAGTVHHGTHFR